jgi:hypothetical protein
MINFGIMINLFKFSFFVPQREHLKTISGEAEDGERINVWGLVKLVDAAVDAEDKKHKPKNGFGDKMMKSERVNNNGKNGR